MKSAHQRSLGTPTCGAVAPFQRKASSSGLVSPDFDAACAAGLASLLRISLLTLLVEILPRLLVESTVLLTVGRRLSPGVVGMRSAALSLR